MIRKRLLISLLSICLVAGLMAQAIEAGLSGEALYLQKCGRCHEAYKAEKYSAEEWETILHEMAPLSAMSPEEEENVLDWLKRTTGKRDRNLPTAPVLGGYVYTEYFSSPASVNTFDAHYLNLNISGRIHDRVTYKAEFEFEHGGGESEPPFVEQAYMDVWFKRNMGLRIGAILTPFNRFDDLHGPLENFLVTRPQMSREIGVSAWKEVGVDLHGNLKLNDDLFFNYNLYVINGLGSGSRLRKSRQYRDNNNAQSMGFRLSGIIADKVEAGVSYYHGPWDDEGDHDLDIFGAHLMATLGDLRLFAEYADAGSENPAATAEGEPTGFADGKADGYFLQASYLFREQFRTTMRYGTLDYFDMADMYGRSPTDKESMVLALGLNYYLTPSIVFKAEYDFIEEGDRIADKDNDLFALQAAFRF